MGRLSFQDEIARNRRSSLLLAVLVSVILFILVYVFVYLLAPEYIVVSLPLSVFLIGLYAFSSYRYGDSVVRARGGDGCERGGQQLLLRGPEPEPS